MNTALNPESSIEARAVAPVERILCPIDFSEISGNRYAQSISGHYHAKLLVQHIVELWQHPSADYSISPDMLEDFRRSLISDAEKELQQFVKTAGGPQPECIVAESVAPDAILFLARERAISLIVLGTHGRRGFDRLMLGSVTERVLRHASCPVLVIPRTAPAPVGPNVQDDPVSVQRILCCVDFSAHSQCALKHAFSLADAYGAEVTLFHVLDGISESADVGKETASAMESLQKLLPAAGHEATKTHLEVRLGKAYPEIVRFASETRPDVIVAGVRGIDALNLAIFGSTLYRVIQLSSAPVLAVPI
ncbi:MAG: universal stress protein [Bryobacteraceae bacterium]|jgi:nucleotide-binding universal stress UspA family protein